MKITIEQVQKNDVILEQGGKKRTEVKKVKTHACSSFGTHINDRLCYERGTEVEVERGAKAEEIADEDRVKIDFSDMPDHDIPISEEIKRYANAS